MQRGCSQALFSGARSPNKWAHTAAQEIPFKLQEVLLCCDGAVARIFQRSWGSLLEGPWKQPGCGHGHSALGVPVQADVEQYGPRGPFQP